MRRNDRAGRKRQRSVNIRTPSFPRLLIISEGIKTETAYFTSIKEQIHNRFKDNIIMDKVDIGILGTGRGTMTVVNYALKSRNRHTYSQVWVLIDKDQFTDFDQAIKKAEDEGLSVAWSNQSFELWYLLHFQQVSSGMDNRMIIDRLSTHLQQKGITRERYSKSNPLTYETLKEYVQLAMDRSEKLLKEHETLRNNKPSRMNPATTVPDLMKLLMPYLE